MRAVAYAALCAAGGLALSGLGFWMMKAAEPRPGETRFVRAWSPTSLLNSGGYLLLFLGLFVAAILAPMVYLAR